MKKYSFLFPVILRRAIETRCGELIFYERQVLAKVTGKCCNGKVLRPIKKAAKISNAVLRNKQINQNNSRNIESKKKVPEAMYNRLKTRSKQNAFISRKKELCKQVIIIY